MTNVKAFCYSLLAHSLVLALVSINFFISDKDSNNSINIVSSSAQIGEKTLIKAKLINSSDVHAAIKRQEQTELLQQKKVAADKQMAQNLLKEAQKLRETVSVKQKELEQQTVDAKKIQQEFKEAKLKLEQEHAAILAKKNFLDKEKAKIKQQKKSIKSVSDIDNRPIKSQETSAVDNGVTPTDNQNANKIASEEASGQNVGTIYGDHNGDSIGNSVDLEVAKFTDIIKQRVYEKRVVSSLFPSGLKCKLRFTMLNDGGVGQITVLESSGNSAYDVMAESAIIRAAPFPIPENVEILKRIDEIIVDFG